MSVEFVDTNVFIYAYDGGAGSKHEKALALLSRLAEEAIGALSVQVLAEFYSSATKKMGMKSQDAEEVIADLRAWTIHRPGHADVLRSIQVQRRYKMAWWDAMVLNSAQELGCTVLWSEDLADKQRYGSVTVRNPFK
jgi:predicted nucleic acid-binding protein